MLERVQSFDDGGEFWSEEFYLLWGPLELIYAESVVYRSPPSAIEQTKLRESVGHIRQLAVNALSRLEPDSLI